MKAHFVSVSRCIETSTSILQHDFLPDKKYEMSPGLGHTFAPGELSQTSFSSFGCGTPPSRASWTCRRIQQMRTICKDRGHHYRDNAALTDRGFREGVKSLDDLLCGIRAILTRPTGLLWHLQFLGSWVHQKQHWQSFLKPILHSKSKVWFPGHGYASLIFSVPRALRDKMKEFWIPFAAFCCLSCIKKKVPLDKRRHSHHTTRPDTRSLVWT